VTQNRTKFDSETKNGLREQFVPSELISDKIQDGGGRHIENGILAITRSVLLLLAQNFTQRLKMGSQSQIYHHFLSIAIIQDGGDRHFEIS